MEGLLHGVDHPGTQGTSGTPQTRHRQLRKGVQIEAEQSQGKHSKEAFADEELEKDTIVPLPKAILLHSLLGLR